MVKKVVYSLLLVSQYSVTFTDVKHFVHHYWIHTESLIMVSIMSSILAVEILVLTNCMIDVISFRSIRSIQRLIHLAFAANSIFWMFKNDNNPISIGTFILALLILFGFVHTLIHKIHINKLQTISSK